MYSRYNYYETALMIRVQNRLVLFSLYLLASCLLILILLLERDYFTLGNNFIPLRSAGNERSFYRLTEWLHYNTRYSWLNFPESKSYIFFLTSCRWIFGDLWFYFATLIQTIVAYFTLIRFLLKRSVIYNLIIICAVLTYSVVLLRDIWVYIFAFHTVLFLKKRKYLWSLLCLFISFDLRVFTGVLVFIYAYDSYFGLKLKHYSLAIAMIAICWNVLPLDDFWTTYSKYRLKEIMEIEEGGITNLLSKFLGPYTAVRLTFLLSPVPTLLFSITGLYSFIMGMGSLILFVWVPKLLESSIGYVLIIVLIAITSAEIRHKMVFILLILHENIRNN